MAKGEGVSKRTKRTSMVFLVVGLLSLAVITGVMSLPLKVIVNIVTVIITLLLWIFIDFVAWFLIHKKWRK